MVIDEDKIPTVNNITGETLPVLTYVNTTHKHFNLLDKIISFDSNQQAIFDLLPPLVIIGSAGSGKTALTLEKMKQATGDVLYQDHYHSRALQRFCLDVRDIQATAEAVIEEDQPAA